MRCNFLLLVLLFNISVFAQSPFGKSEQRFKGSLHYIELSGGLILPSFNYFDTSMDGVAGELFFNHTEGLAFRSQFRRHFSFSPRITYEVRGGHYIIDNISYKIKTQNGSFLIPLEYNGYFSKDKKLTKPGWLLYAGPYVSYYFGGRIEYDNNEFLMENDDLSSFDFGAELGVGIRVPTFSFTGQGNFTLKAAFYHGFISSYPKNNNSRIERFGDLMFSESGQRYNMGWKLTLTYEIALSSKKITTFTAGGDGKKTYKRFILKN
ncbi:MAG: outer membrane beta-barrel protein [Prolixibacteraceae bacterium]|jgi:hypothetical protein|nr:outer membrane beta-barrel protein [Prolixibacteraceae bacterium]